MVSAHPQRTALGFSLWIAMAATVMVLTGPIALVAQFALGWWLISRRA